MSGVHHNVSCTAHTGDGDETSETVHDGSLHGSEIDLVGQNSIMVKHEYQVRVEEQAKAP